MNNKVSIIIPAYNEGQHTVNCLKGVLTTCDVKFEILLIDDGSTELIYKVLPKLFPDIKILRNETNLGFIKSVNKGIRAATGNYILLLNNDVDVSKKPLWLKILLAGMRRRKLDMCAPSGGNLDRKYNYIPGESTKETDKFSYLPFWCCLIKKNVINEVGLLDEQMGLGFWDDVDYCFRAQRAKFKIGVIEVPDIKHLYHQTFLKCGINLQSQYEKNRQIFLNKWGILQ